MNQASFENHNMLVSFYILAYNHESMIGDAIQGALSQTYPNLEIIISDDCSTDNTWSIIQNLVHAYRGRHQIVTRRNSCNLGISAHINEIWKISNGQWIFASAGDDVSVPERVSKCMALALQNPEIKLIQSWLMEVDSTLNPLGINTLACKDEGKGHSPTAYFFQLSDRVQGRSYAAHGAAMAYSREIVDEFGPMNPGIVFEDNVVNIRAELLGIAAVIPKALVMHRNHEGQITSMAPTINMDKLEASRAMRLKSDILTTSLNLVDYESLLGHHNQRDLSKYNDWFRKRVLFYQIKSEALSVSWPLRLYYYLKLVLLYGQRDKISRDDFYRCIMPNWLYYSLKKWSAKLNG